MTNGMKRLSLTLHPNSSAPTRYATPLRRQKSMVGLCATRITTARRFFGHCGCSEPWMSTTRSPTARSAYRNTTLDALCFVRQSMIKAPCLLLRCNVHRLSQQYSVVRRARCLHHCLSYIPYPFGNGARLIVLHRSPQHGIESSLSPAERPVTLGASSGIAGGRVYR